MDKHDELCEKADVGSICDCSCAGRKHAVARTKGGVPGAGGVSKRAQKAASAAGKAAVINNKAEPKDGARVAPSAPKSFRDAKTGTGAKTAAKAEPDEHPIAKARRDAAEKLHAAATETERWQEARIAQLKADNPGLSISEIVKKGRNDPEFKRRLEAHQAAIAEARQTLSRDEVDDILTNGLPAPKKPSAKQGTGSGPVRDTVDYTDRVKPAGPYKQAYDATMAAFDGTGAQMVAENNTEVGDRVTHRTKGKGTITKVGRVGNPHTVKYDSGETAPEFGHDLVHGEHTPKAAPAARKPISLMTDLRTVSDADLAAEHARIEATIRPRGGISGPQRDVQQAIEREQARRKGLTSGGGYSPEQAAQRDQARNARLGHSQGRRARVDELAPLSREQFDKLPADEQQRALADLRRIADSGDQRSVRGTYGISGKADQRHVGRAADLLRRFTAPAKPAEPAKAPPAQQYAALTDSRQVEPFLKGLGRAELTDLATAKGWLTADEAGKSKLAYLRDQIKHAAWKDMDTRQTAGIRSGGTGGPDAARKDVAAVLSRRRNGDATAEQAPIARKTPAQATGEGGFAGSGRNRVKTVNGNAYKAEQQPDGQWRVVNPDTNLGMGVFPSLAKAGEVVEAWEKAQRAPQPQSRMISTPGGRPVAGRRDATERVQTRQRDGSVTDTGKPAAGKPASPAGGGDAGTFAGKKVKPVTPAQQPVLEAVGNGSKYKDSRGKSVLPFGAVQQMERKKLITTVFSNGDVHLTELGHRTLAAQRGDTRHQELNEKVAAAEAELGKAGQARAAHTERRNEPLYRDFARNSAAVQQTEREAYGRFMLAKKERDDYVKAKAKPA